MDAMALDFRIVVGRGWRSMTRAWPSHTCKECARSVGWCCKRHQHHVGTACSHCGQDER